ncbi:hypothetical protein LCGC14_0390800 [marine sediment metagenome]|uniref:J domain-containing protein n=1 Tax=marine sediment metagenome TaxID=412755 RepID=A0A0F9SZW4_9ZZZZ
MNCNFVFRPIDNWPGERNRRPRSSAFRTKYNQTLELLDKELLMLGVRQVVIQIDLPESKIRFDGLPRSGARPDYQGVILRFESKYGHLRYATDVFDFWQDNLRAIALGLEALRKVDRYGITKRGEQYTGWKQLPAAGVGDIHAAAAFLARYSNLTPLDILKDKEVYRQAYRASALKLHPDKGGNVENFTLLQKIKKLFENHFN